MFSEFKVDTYTLIHVLNLPTNRKIDRLKIVALNMTIVKKGVHLGKA